MIYDSVSNDPKMPNARPSHWRVGVMVRLRFGIGFVVWWSLFRHNSMLESLLDQCLHHWHSPKVLFIFRDEGRGRRSSNRQQRTRPEVLTIVHNNSAARLNLSATH